MLREGGTGGETGPGTCGRNSSFRERDRRKGIIGKRIKNIKNKI